MIDKDICLALWDGAVVEDDCAAGSVGCSLLAQSAGDQGFDHGFHGCGRLGGEAGDDVDRAVTVFADGAGTVEPTLSIALLGAFRIESAPACLTSRRRTGVRWRVGEDLLDASAGLGVGAGRDLVEHRGDRDRRLDADASGFEVGGGMRIPGRT